MASTSPNYRLWQHSNGTWYVLWGETGSSRRVSTRTKNRSAAQKFLKQFEAGFDRPAISSNATVGEILDGYLEDRKGQVAHWDRLSYSCKPLKQFFGDLFPHQLARETMRRYARHRASQKDQRGSKRGGHIKDGTIIREVTTLRAALRWAASDKILPEMPVIFMPVKRSKPRKRWLLPEEAQKLLKAAKSPFHLYVFIMLGLNTGARSAAILELKWEQVDLDKRLIDFGDGEGNKRRGVVPINDTLYRTLELARELAVTDHVVEHKGKRLLFIKKSFAKACEAAGLKNVTPHVLRHTVATWAVMNGVSMEGVAKLLADSVETTEKVYAKHSPDFLKKAVDALSVTLENGAEKMSVTV